MKNIGHYDPSQVPTAINSWPSSPAMFSPQQQHYIEKTQLIWMNV
jgi:hypothetical protein